MKANTALLAVLSAGSLTATLSRRSERMLRVGRMLALLVLGVALAVLAEYLFHVSIGLDTLLAPDFLAVRPGRMSPQSAAVFALLGILMAMIRAYEGLLATVADMILGCTCLLTLSILSGYFFSALRLFGPSMGNRTSPQTLALLILLAFVAFSRRAEYGAFGILLGIGTGGKIARIAAPIALVLPFLLGATSIVLIRTGEMDLRYAIGIVTSVASILTFGTVVVLSRLIEIKEDRIRDLSLRDALTDIYNRRGFYVHAEQALRMATRARMPFSVLFIDLDNLKTVNDSLGHEAGSIFLREVADLLRGTFRTSEIIGRIGGDEFAVALEAEPQILETITNRLEAEVKKQNAMPGRPYPFSFSLGSATAQPGQLLSLDGLLASADKSMYGAKLRNKVESLLGTAR